MQGKKCGKRGSNPMGGSGGRMRMKQNKKMEQLGGGVELKTA